MHSFTKAKFYRAKRKNNTIYNGKSWREGGAGAQLRLHEAPPVFRGTTMSIHNAERRGEELSSSMSRTLRSSFRYHSYQYS
jgi:hypothetical protein